MDKDYSCQRCSSNQTSVTDERIHICFECGYKFIVEPEKRAKKISKNSEGIIADTSSGSAVNWWLSPPPVDWGEIRRTIEVSRENIQDTDMEQEQIESHNNRRRNSFEAYVNEYYQNYVRPQTNVEATSINELEELIIRNETNRMEVLPF